MMQIADHIHALKIPFQIAGPFGKRIDRFVYVFLICGERICLVDSGVAGSERIIFQYLKDTGRSPQDISMLILTHAHPDHIGSAAAIKRITGCTVAAHASERAWIEDVALQAKERPVPGFFDLVGGSVEVDRVLGEGDELILEGGPDLQVLHTPGHSPGSISLWMAKEGALFTADAIPIAGEMPIYQDILASVRSVKRLASIPDIKLLLAAWDEPRPGEEAYRIMNKGLGYLQRIHSGVLRAAREDPALVEQDFMQLCKKALAELGLPPFMANPLVAASFRSSLREDVRDRPDLLKVSMHSAYDDEDKIVWLRDHDALAAMDFVREEWLFCPIRTGPVRVPPGEALIGYAVLKKTAAKTDERGFCRRIFTLLPEDRFRGDNGGVGLLNELPPDAVDPLLIVAGKPGHWPDLTKKIKPDYSHNREQKRN
jgi:glyoxylase-like metal-dependent hydrolase (beta-lactamase superfamily II)